MENEVQNLCPEMCSLDHSGCFCLQPSFRSSVLLVQHFSLQEQPDMVHLQPGGPRTFHLRSGWLSNSASLHTPLRHHPHAQRAHSASDLTQQPSSRRCRSDLQGRQSAASASLQEEKVGGSPGDCVHELRHAVHHPRHDSDHPPHHAHVRFRSQRLRPRDQYRSGHRQHAEPEQRSCEHVLVRLHSVQVPPRTPHLCQTGVLQVQKQKS